MLEHSDTEKYEPQVFNDVLRRISPAVDQLVQEHLDAFGELLPTIILSRVADWFTSAAESRREVEDARRLANELDRVYREGNERIQDSIDTGFLEMLPSPGEDGRTCVEFLGPTLWKRLEDMENWVPPERRKGSPGQ